MKYHEYYLRKIENWKEIVAAAKAQGYPTVAKFIRAAIAEKIKKDKAKAK